MNTVKGLSFLFPFFFCFVFCYSLCFFKVLAQSSLRHMLPQSAVLETKSWEICPRKNIFFTWQFQGSHGTLLVSANNICVLIKILNVADTLHASSIGKKGPLTEKKKHS